MAKKSEVPIILESPALTGDDRWLAEMFADYLKIFLLLARGFMMVSETLL